MTSRKNVHDAHISRQVRELHGALLDIVGVLNQPQRDDQLLEKAGVRLDGALFPLLVGVGRYGPIGVVDLAERSGRDYTTVSRQTAKLEALGLIDRRASATDGRVREAVLTADGEAALSRLDAARTEMGRAVFASWEPREVDELVRLMRRFADAMQAGP